MYSKRICIPRNKYMYSTHKYRNTMYRNVILLMRSLNSKRLNLYRKYNKCNRPLSYKF